MSELTPDNEAGKPPAQHPADDDPAKTLIKFFTSWGFIGTLFAACGAGLWAIIGESIIGTYSICAGFGLCGFLVFHKIFPKWSSLKRYGWASIFSVCVAVATLALALRIESIKQSEREKLQWQPPEMPADCKVAYLLYTDAEFQIDLEQAKRNGNVFALPGFPELLTVRIKNNRLYADVANSINVQFLNPNWPSKWVDPTTNQHKGAFSDIGFLDQKLPAGYDRNYSANAIEIVNPNRVPVYQAIYLSINLSINLSIYLSINLGSR